MIKAVKLADNNVMFGAKPEKKENGEVESRILPNTLRTRMQQKYQKTTNAFLQYPVKGFKGDVNSDFYQWGLCHIYLEVLCLWDYLIC